MVTCCVRCCGHRSSRKGGICREISFHKPIENAECDLSNEYEGNLKQQIMPSHEKELSPRLACELCSYESLQKPDLKKHMAIHTEMVKTCILCEASFEHKYQLDAHYVSAHPNQMNVFKHLLTFKVYECFSCSYVTVYLTGFKNHLLLHEVGHMKFHDEILKVKRKNRSYRQKNRLPIVCKECDKVFTTQQHLDSHILCKHKENKQLVKRIRSKVHQCLKCSYEAINITNFKNHLLRHEKGENRFKCGTCDYKCVARSQFKRHLRGHTGELPHKCTGCNKKFIAKRELDSHILFQHKENKQLRKSITRKVHQCSKCSFETIRIIHLNSHLLRHEDRFKCGTCNYKCVDRSSFKIHSRQYKGELPHVCTECNKAFNRKQQLDSHILSEHKKNEQLRKSITNKVHQCPKCSYESVGIGNFKTHLLKHEKGGDKFKFKCGVCDYKCFYRSDFKRHLRRHTDQLPHKCTKCNRKFVTKRELDSHILRHHKENKQLMKTITTKIHQCLKCSFETINITHFKTHLFRHDKFKFKCDICDYKCIDRSSFRKHSRRHTSQLPHKCTECNKAFNQKQQLSRHILSRHKRKRAAEEMNH